MSMIFQRTSIRAYSDQEVEKEKLELLLRAGMAAPSAGNQQPWEFIVVHNRKILKELSSVSPYAGCVQDASVAIVTCYRRECIYPEYREADMAAVTENILLAATEQGLGGVWLGIAPLADRMDRAADALSLREDLSVYSIIPIGYPLRRTEPQNRFDRSRIQYLD